MTNLFKKMVTPSRVSVKEVHNEFAIAQDVLVKEAKKIIEQSPTNSIEKSKRLVAAGFHSSKTVVDNRKISFEIEKARETLKNVEYYSQHYPSYKFITEEQIGKICKKYNLVLGTINLYLGDVPDKNLKEIEEFSLREEDYSENWVKTGDNSWISYSEIMNSMWSSYHVGSQSETKKGAARMQICATKEEMHIQGLKIAADGYTLVDKDPIVLQPVNGGCLIISKWGAEASDNDLVNEKLN